MRSGFHIARIFGINIYIEWSWILIFVLVTWNLAGGLFPALHPEWSLGLNIAVSLFASILFFGSVLAHELAHSLVAKSRGLPVRSITLFIFGGVSNISKEPPSPLTEFLMAIVGPLTSFILGVIFLLLAGFSLNTAMAGINNPMAFLRNLGPVTTTFVWLGPINILLAVFNMIPGFPLDGGRVLRSILWAITDNLRRATRWATMVGQLVAWLFILTGIAMIFGVNVPFFGSGIIGGLWLAFIGWFLNNAADQSYRQVVIDDVLEGVPVSRIMRPEAHSVQPEITISQLVDDHLMATDERAFPVLDNQGTLVGLIALDDIRKVPRQRWDEVKVAQVMTPVSELETVTPNEDASDALTKLNARDVRQMPVVDSGRMVGMLRRRDIIRWLQLHSNLARS